MRSIEAEISARLQRLARVFDVEQLLSQPVSQRDVGRYYNDSYWMYKLFHTRSGALHFPVNWNGKLDESGLYEQPEMVQTLIDYTRPKAVLELASGKGFNSAFLAERNPEIRFTGIDLTLAHLREAKRRARGVPNLTFHFGNFQDLQFQDASFDGAFVVESLCHATDMRRALSEACRVIRPGGWLLVIDGCRKPGFNELSCEIRRAARLVEVGVALPPVAIIDDWLEVASAQGFEVASVQEITRSMLPQLRRFEVMARLYFLLPPAARLANKLLPADATKNAMTGYLLPLTIRIGAQGYYAVTLRRPGRPSR